MRPDDLEPSTDRYSAAGGTPAAPTGVTERLNGPGAALQQILRGRLNKRAADAGSVLLRLYKGVTSRIASGLTGLVGKLAARGTIDGGAYRT